MLSLSLEEKKEINIDGDNFHYLANVMRCEVGSVVFLFNENDGEFLAKVSSKLNKVLKLTIHHRKEYEKIDNNFSIIFCPPKSHKLDILVQKCTEIGVKNFVPVISERTENRNLNINRMKKIILLLFILLFICLGFSGFGLSGFGFPGTGFPKVKCNS